MAFVSSYSRIFASTSCKKYVLTKLLPLRRYINRCYHEVSFAEANMDPSKVLQYYSSSSSSSSVPLSLPVMAKSNDSGCWVLVQLLAAPWNPADMNTVQGRYPAPTHEYESLRKVGEGRIVAGSEGIGKVVEIHPGHSSASWNTGNDTAPLEAGDLVVLGLPGLGSFRSHIWVPLPALLRLNLNNDGVAKRDVSMSKNELCQWATLLQVGGTAWRLLMDYNVQGLEHFSVIQNAPLSNVGYMVRQLISCVYPSSHVINVLRQGTRKEKSEPDLLQNASHGSTFVTEEELESCRNSKEMWQWIVNESNSRKNNDLVLTRPVLALDSVAGPSGSRLLQLLDQGGYLVNYGALSKQPLNISAPQLIFQDRRVQGYWHSRWMEQSTVSAKQTMLDDLVRLVEEGKVHLPPIQRIPLVDFRAALIEKEMPCDSEQHESKTLSAGPLRIALPSQRKIVFDLSET